MCVLIWRALRGTCVDRGPIYCKLMVGFHFSVWFSMAPESTVPRLHVNGWAQWESDCFKLLNKSCLSVPCLPVPALSLAFLIWSSGSIHCCQTSFSWMMHLEVLSLWYPHFSYMCSFRHSLPLFVQQEITWVMVSSQERIHETLLLIPSSYQKSEHRRYFLRMCPMDLIFIYLHRSDNFFHEHFLNVPIWARHLLQKWITSCSFPEKRLHSRR